MKKVENVNTIRSLLNFASIIFHELLEMHTGKNVTDFYFRD